MNLVSSGWLGLRAASAAGERLLSTSAACCSTAHRPEYRGNVKMRRAGVYKMTERQDLPLTYEQARRPEHIGVSKAWSSFNTSGLHKAPRAKDTMFEDYFIRKFMYGTWHKLFLSQVVIKRNMSLIRIVGIVRRDFAPYKYYFLVGYTEKMLSYILKCPIKVEIQTAETADMVFRYV